MNYSEVVEIAREYYNSDDADRFYYTIWGGEDIHIGMYQSESDPIFDASRRTVEEVASQIKGLDASKTVLDIGAGYGGAARYLAKTYGCRVVALNLSEIENARNREMNREQGLDHLIDVVDASFEDLPYEDGTFDVVWSQDAILHSGNREKVVQEVARVLKTGGQFIFTDIMQTDDCPENVLDPILARIHLSTLGSPRFYREAANTCGMKEVGFIPYAHQLVNHYSRVLKETEKKEKELKLVVSEDYISRMKTGLNHWVNGGQNGYITWGIFHFEKNGN